MRDRTPVDALDDRARFLKMKSVLHDRATGLPALPLLFDRLRTWLDDRRQIGVLHFEFDDLRLVESLYGWQVFDRLVGVAADALRACRGRELPDGAAIAINGVAGDRFVVFVRDAPGGAACDAGGMTRLAAAVRGRLEGAFDGAGFAGLSPTPTVRAGHALLAENPFYRFERCVYAAVDEARGAHARRERRRERSWGDELRSIIRGGSVHAVFQPVVDLDTRSVVGHEALARGPRDSLFETPQALFAMSERMGLAEDLDRLCRASALAASEELAGRGRLFLNLWHGACDAASGEAAHLESSLAEHGLGPQDVVFELCERATGADPEPLARRLRALRERGFGVALDDVGTGRTRLDAIRRIAPDFLKLDASLVRNLHRSLMQQEVLATLVGLAGAIGAVVIGEGVEAENEARALRAGGARLGQGHLFAAPASARDLRSSDRNAAPGAR